jgi:signal transduction histidine kinase
MQPLTRYLGLALIPLLTFLAVAVAGQAWFEKETRRLQADAIAVRQAQLVQALAITHRAPETWDEPFQRDLGALLGGTVTLGTATGEAVPGKTHASGLLAFDFPFPGAAGLHARVTFSAPMASRLVVVHERMLVAVTLLAVLLLMVFIVMALPHRSSTEGGGHPPWPGARAEMAGLEHFARISVERGEALERESGARHRAEEDLQLSRTLLGQSLEERVQLGRELHDNICQTLYAVSLTLEGLRRKVAGSGDAEPRLDQCITELRRLNHEVRSYLKDLEPQAVLRQPFMEALNAMLASQAGDGGPRLVQNLAADAIALITPERATEVVSILREAVSNSLRHARARTVTVRAIRNDAAVVFAVQDDGAGFEPAAAGPGHGLGNMQARAAALGGTLEVISAPGKGTRVLLTFPVISAP